MCFSHSALCCPPLPPGVSAARANLSATPGGHSDSDLHQLNNLKWHYKSPGPSYLLLMYLRRLRYRFVVLRPLIHTSTSRLRLKPLLCAPPPRLLADLSSSVTFPHDRYVVLCDICKHLIIPRGCSFNGFDHKVKPVIQTAGTLQTVCADHPPPPPPPRVSFLLRNPEVNTRLLTGPSEGNESLTLSWRRWRRYQGGDVEQQPEQQRADDPFALQLPPSSSSPSIHR